MTDTYIEALRTAAERLRVAQVPSPEWDARILMAHLLHCNHMSIPLHEEQMPGFAIALDALLRRREAREPLQHILGEAPFGPLELEVGPGVFIPRPETEVLADWAVRTARQLAAAERPEGGEPSGHEASAQAASASSAPAGRLRVVDLCTGSGALAAYLAHYLPAADVTAVELSDAAFAYAVRNLTSPNVNLVQGDVLDQSVLAELNGTVDLIVSNPPYVPEAPDLEPEVYHDPHMAVFGGEDGMSIIVPMLDTIARLARPGAWIGIEHDDATSAATQAAFRAHGGFCDVMILKDLAGVARFVLARRAKE